MSQPENRNVLIISEFRANHGRSRGAFRGAPLLLLRRPNAVRRNGTTAKHMTCKRAPQ